MRILLAICVALVVASPAAAEPSRAAVIIDRLDVDDATAHRLLDLLVRYDHDLDKLERERASLKLQLFATKHKDPNALDQLLDATIANERAVVDAHERMLGRVRTLLSTAQTVRLLMLLSVTETSRTAGARADLVRPEAFTPACDPFESMHGCSVR